MHLLVCIVSPSPKSHPTEYVARIQQYLNIIEGIPVRGIILIRNDDARDVPISQLQQSVHQIKNPE